MNEALGNTIASPVFFLAAIGITAGLFVELGVATRVPPWLRRFIGVKNGDQGPSRPRAWALVAGLALLVLVEATMYARLMTALERSDSISAVALGLHFVAFGSWLLYLSVRRRVAG